jgi:hypothetical protein
MSAFLGAYGIVRFVWLASNIQEMTNASGYGFERLEGPQIRERFGAGLSRFSIYNVLASAATVLFSEPRGGVFVFLRAWSMDDVPPRMWINVLSSTVTTLLMAGMLLRERHRAALVFLAVLLASAVASFAYAKDEIMSVAGVFYAIATFWAVRSVLMRPLRAPAAVTVAIVLLAASTGWAIRTVGVNHVLRAQAFAVHNDWAVVPDAMQRRGTWPDDSATRNLVLGLRNQSLGKAIVNPWFMARWADRVFDGDY